MPSRNKNFLQNGKKGLLQDYTKEKERKANAQMNEA